MLQFHWVHIYVVKTRFTLVGANLYCQCVPPSLEWVLTANLGSNPDCRVIPKVPAMSSLPRADTIGIQRRDSATL